jgi:hypothetical protein
MNRDRIFSATNSYLVGTFAVFLLALSGCAAVTPAQYKRVTLGVWAGWNGYLDKEIAPGVHVVEVTQIGGYVHNMDVLKAHWLRRANELCPNGYTGGYEVILPYQAKLEELRCDRRFCQDYPMVSGIIRCKGATPRR